MRTLTPRDLSDVHPKDASDKGHGQVQRRKQSQSDRPPRLSNRHLRLTHYRFCELHCQVGLPLHGFGILDLHGADHDLNLVVQRCYGGA